MLPSDQKVETHPVMNCDATSKNEHADISIPTVKSRFRDNDTTLLTLTSHFFAKFVPQRLELPTESSTALSHKH